MFGKRIVAECRRVVFKIIKGTRYRDFSRLNKRHKILNVSKKILDPN